MIELTRLHLAIAAALLILALGLGLCAFVRRRGKVVAALGDAEVLRQMGLAVDGRPWRRILVPACGGLALAGALLDPSLGAGPPARRGPVVLLLDASGSMLVHDTGAPRLAIQRELASDLVAQLGDTPIGVVAFAGRAFSLTPPTRDLGAVDMYLSTVDPTIVTQSGSALGAAIRQGLGLITAGEGGAGGTIILIGDGDETDDEAAALEAAELAGRNEISIHSLGVGSEEGAPVPSIDLSTGTASGYLTDDNGEAIISRAQPALLRDIAERSDGGVYVSAAEQGAVSRIVETIRPSGSGIGTGEGAWPLYFWLGLAAFLMLLLQPLLETLSRRHS